jgi:hypothetical protein
MRVQEKGERRMEEEVRGRGREDSKEVRRRGRGNEEESVEAALSCWNNVCGFK